MRIMRHILSTTIAATTMAIAASAPAAAQNADIERAIDQVKESNAVTTSTTSTVEDTGNKTVYYYRYEFTLPKKDKKLVTQLEKAFKAGKDDAYYSVFQEKDAENYKRVAVALPGGGTITAGSDDDFYSRVLCYKDPSDANYRYSYVLEWTDDEDDNEEAYTGFVAKVFGKKPSADNRTFTFSMPSVDKDGKLKISKGTIRYDKNGKTMIIDGDGQIASVLGNDTVNIGDKNYNISKIIINGNGYDNDDNNADNVLQKFGFYRQHILENSKSSNDATSLNLYVNAMYKLCKNAAAKGLLNKAEREICAKELQTLAIKIAKTADSFSISLLEQAAKLLQGDLQGA